MPLLSSFFQNLKDSAYYYTHSNTDLLALWAIILTITWYLWLFFKSKTQHNLPPGPRGLPIFGNLLSLNPELHSYFADLARIYGPLMKLRLGGKLGIIITSPYMARHVLQDHDTIFANRANRAASRIASYGGNDIITASYGPEWRMLRKVCVLKMLSNTTLDSVYELRRTEVRKMVKFLYSQVELKVNIGEQAFLTQLNVITNMMWGGGIEEVERERVGATFRETVTKMTSLLGKLNVSDFFPWLARFDLQGVEKQMNELVSRFDQIFDKMIGQRVKMEKEKRKKERKDFLQFLLDLKEEEYSQTPLTITQVKALLLNMVVAGSDTSSNTIEFAMAEIMQKPEVMKRVQEELEVVVGKDNIVEESHIHNLPYLHAVIKEVLRLHPVLPLLVSHCPSETSTVGGHTIPNGSIVFVNVWAIHRDPSIWENPLEFDPTRFLKVKWDFINGNDFNYFPFGSGRRMCAGIAMAERTVLYSLATLVHSFDWTIPRGEKLNVLEKFGLVLKKKIPLVAIPTPRLSNLDLYK
ncbi:hypothetical protein RIF29_34218 [Crotalaria pallida]|uniref:Cytochrome P450 n=1 Tax=Crotalaria pallida TaxID=3830 RepID=A0AAN9E966_CROPI